MISARVPPDGPVLLLGPVRGLDGDAGQVLRALDAYAPTAIGLGVSPEEMRGLLDYFVRSEAEPVVPLTRAEAGEVQGLVRFGEVGVPNPSLVDTLSWADSRSVPVAPLDPSDEGAAELFTEHIGYRELGRRTVRERRVGRSPPTPSSADEFALVWDREVAGGSGSQRFARARDRYLARGAARLAEERGRVAIVVDRERFEAVRDYLTHGTPLDPSDG